MTEFIKSLAPSADESLKHLTLAHLKINSKVNCEGLGILIAVKSAKLEVLNLEGMFGKKSLADSTYAHLSRMVSCNTL